MIRQHHIFQKSVWIFIFVHIGLLAFATNSIFKNYTVSDGLVTKSVTNIMQDKDGFIWIATTNGISRFDGYNFKNFTNFESDSHSMNGSFVFAIAEGANNTIWLSTDAGIEYYDKTKEEFHLLIHPDLKQNLYLSNMVADEEGNIWLSHGQSNLIVYSPKSNSVEFKKLPVPFPQDSSLIIHKLAIHKNNLWVACNRGIGFYSLKQNNYTWVDTLPHQQCTKIHVTDSSTLVFTFPQEGICILNEANGSSKWISKQFIDSHIGPQSQIFDATEDADGNVYIAVSPGIAIVSGTNVTHYNSNSSEHFFEGNSFNNLYRDHNDNIWIGTFENGIFLKKRNETAVKFNTELYKKDVIRTRIASFQIFENNTLLYDDTKAVYLCRDYRDLHKGSATKLFEAPLILSFPLDSHRCIISRSDSSFIFNSQNQSLTYSHMAVAPASSYLDRNGIIWTGSWNGTLIGFDEAKNSKYEISISAFAQSQATIFCINGDTDGSLWLGTLGAGLVHVLNPTAEEPKIEFYNKRAEGKYHLNTNMILSMHSDKYNNLWIGTNGIGLAKMNKDSSSFQFLTIKNGLQSNIIESITSDLNGNIWFATGIISKYDVKNKTLTNYLHAEEVQGSFMVKACATSSMGHVLFASTRGIYTFMPEAITNEEIPSAPFLTNLRVKGISMSAGDTILGLVPYTRSISYSHKITLPFELNSFSIEFASLEFNEFNTINYQYHLQGIDDDWVTASSVNRIASYAGIQPGTYTFEVRASKGSNNWSEPTLLIIEIVPPWYKTIWFKFTSLATILLIVSAVIWFRFRRIKNLNKVLEEKVVQRTEKLSEANMLLQESHVVLEMKNEQIEEALKAKDRLIRVIGHDFKNPLSALRGLIVLMRDNFKQFETQKNEEILQSIDSASSNLENQMKNVLEWAMADRTEIIFKPQEINIETLLADSVELVKKSAERKKIAIELQFDFQSNVFVDVRMISTVLRNLLINAIKFSPEHSTVAIIVQEYDEEIEISVVDSGLGIPSETLNSLFNSNEINATADTENMKSTGIGLRLCKLFVEKNFGTLRAQSNEERGSVFSFTVPKGRKQAVRKDTIVLEKTQKSNTLETLSIKQDKSVTVLIIDDNENILSLLKNLLEPYYTVISARNGKSGMQMASNLIPSLIISDISMPLVSGIDLCQALKEDNATSKVPIILLTANDNLMQEGYASGADDFIVKPFDEKELLLKSHSLLENRKRLIEEQVEKTEESLFILPESYDDLIMKNLLSYVNQHFSEESIDVNTLGETFGLSRTQLWRKFKSTTGQNLSDYIKSLRMTKAKEMLLTGKYKVSEVGYEVGYSSPPYFTKCFTQHFGYTPSECVEKNKS